MEFSASIELAKTYRKAIHTRLVDEDEDELAELIDKCGKPLRLTCVSCGHLVITETRCKQKWCPVCVRAIATRRSLKFTAAAAAMQWPLFLTLTVPNIQSSGVPFIRKLRRDFGKLRHRKLWKTNVTGGVAAIEVTNLSARARKHRQLRPGLTGWHPHLHALLDCKWLALRTPPPQPGSSRDEARKRCRAAKRELTDLWKTCTGHKHGITWVQRASGATTATEVLKYSVKGSDLIASPDPLGPLIHQLRATRLTTSFGTLFGKNFQAPKLERACEKCGSFEPLVPDSVLNSYFRRAA